MFNYPDTVYKLIYIYMYITCA